MVNFPFRRNVAAQAIGLISWLVLIACLRGYKVPKAPAILIGMLASSPIFASAQVLLAKIEEIQNR